MDSWWASGVYKTNCDYRPTVVTIRLSSLRQTMLSAGPYMEGWSTCESREGICDICSVTYLDYTNVVINE